jgi:superfamily II DNA or RNA helicase
MNLRPHQTRDSERIRHAFEQFRRIMYQAPTGSGKTILFCHLAREAAVAGERVCILVHRRELLRQASRALAYFKVYHGLISPDYPRTPALVQVASKDTLRRRADRDFELVIVDEAHHASADTYEGIMAGADRVLGVSATPARLTGRGLGTVFEHLICGPTVKSLTPEYLSPYQLFAPPCQVDLSGLRAQAGDYRRDAAAAAMDRRSITGDAVAHYKQHLNGAPAIAFCCSVEHAYHVAEQFQEAGFRAEGVDGTLDQDARDDRIAALGDGRLNVLTSCSLVDEGLDVPGVVGIIDLSPTKSLTRCMQRWGRGLRVAPGKERAIILDHVGNVWRHGMPDAERKWSLEEGVTTAKPDEIKEHIRQCPECYFAHDYAPECPVCGHVYKVKPKKPPSYVEGVLSKVTISEEEFKDVLNKAKSLNDWQVIARHKGYKPGWAWHQFQKKIAGRKLA